MTTENSGKKHPFQLFQEEAGRYPRVSKAEEKTLLKRLANGDEAAANRLAQGNLRLVAYLASMRSGGDIDRAMDFVGPALEGLTKAIQNYDPEKGAWSATLGVLIDQAITNEFVRQQLKRNGGMGSTALSAGVPGSTQNIETQWPVVRTPHGLKEYDPPDERDYEEADTVFDVKRVLQAIRDTANKSENVERTIHWVCQFYGVEGHQQRTRIEIAYEYGCSPQRVTQILDRAIARAKKHFLDAGPETFV